MFIQYFCMVLLLFLFWTLWCESWLGFSTHFVNALCFTGEWCRRTKMNKTNQDWVTKATQSTEDTPPSLLSAQFLLPLCFLTLSDAMWLDIGVTPSGPSKICWSDQALPEDLGHEHDRVFSILWAACMDATLYWFKEVPTPFPDSECSWLRHTYK